MCMSVNASLQRNSIYQRFFRNALNLEERTKKEQKKKTVFVIAINGKQILNERSIYMIYFLHHTVFR